MGLAIRPTPWTFITSGGWADFIDFCIGDAETPDDLDGMDVRMMFTPPHIAAVDLTEYCTVDGGRVSWSIPRSVTDDYQGGDGSLEVNVRPDGEPVDRWVVRGPVKVVKGT